MSALALDIGTYSIKALAGNPGKVPDITRNLEVINPLAMSIPTDETGAQKLGAHIDNLIKDHKLPITGVRLSLPESVVATKIIEIPALNDAELASAIGWQAEQHIPIPMDELSLEYKVLYRPGRKEKGEKMRVLLVGVRKAVVETYVNMFLDIGIEPEILETQALSILRALNFTDQDPTTLVVDIGASSLEMSVVSQGELSFIYSHLSGGDLLSRALEQSLGLDPNSAEQYKRQYGLAETQFQGKIRQALLSTVDVLLNEVNKAIQFYVHQHPRNPVRRILLSGGTSLLPGLVEYVTQRLGTEVLVASPFSGCKGIIPDANHPSYTVCVGLLMRQLD